MLIKKEFPSFNSRRYRAPWGAKVTFPDGIRPVYDFVGHWDRESVLINANVGDILAFGQKDTRGNNSSKQLYRVGDGGELSPVSESQAREYATAA